MFRVCGLKQRQSAWCEASARIGGRVHHRDFDFTYAKRVIHNLTDEGDVPPNGSHFGVNVSFADAVRESHALSARHTQQPAHKS
jgi:hypothetical protein